MDKFSYLSKTNIGEYICLITMRLKKLITKKSYFYI